MSFFLAVALFSLLATPFAGHLPRYDSGVASFFFFAITVFPPVRERRRGVRWSIGMLCAQGKGVPFPSDDEVPFISAMRREGNLLRKTWPDVLFFFFPPPRPLRHRHCTGISGPRRRDMRPFFFSEAEAASFSFPPPLRHVIFFLEC